MSYYYDSNQVVLGGANVGQDLFASGKLWFKVFYLIPFPSMTWQTTFVKHKIFGKMAFKGELNLKEWVVASIKKWCDMQRRQNKDFAKFSL